MTVIRVELPKIVTRVESLTRVTLSLANSDHFEVFAVSVLLMLWAILMVATLN